MHLFGGGSSVSTTAVPLGEGVEDNNDELFAQPGAHSSEPAILQPVHVDDDVIDDYDPDVGMFWQDVFAQRDVEEG